MELYEVRNFRTAESRIFRSLDDAVAAAGEWRTNDQSVSRVSDGAMWHALIPRDGRWVEVEGFGPRIYTETGDAIRLERAERRLPPVEVAA